MGIDFSTIKERLLQEFETVFNHKNNLSFTFAPGRVNIIGEHTDYNGGNVFPVAIDIGSFLVLSPRSDKQVRAYSMNFPEEGICTLSIDAKEEVTGWAKYLVGIIRAFQVEKNIHFEHGFDIVLFGNIPDGAGLSSSASVCVSLAYAFDSLFHCQLDKLELVKIAQKAEHLVGVNCGIMDQFASAMGKKDHGILLDCNTLDYTYVPLNLGKYTLVIMDSKKQRQLQDSKYNERRAECEKAVEYLQKEISIKTLGELTEEQFEQYKHNIPDPILLKRAKHAVTENQRTLKALACLEKNDIEHLGILLNESHYSLRDDYEVTGMELDSLTDIARSYTGVLGSRMTGAGFGGCCIALVPSDTVEGFITHVQKNYHLNAEFYQVMVEDGVRHF